MKISELALPILQYSVLPNFLRRAKEYKVSNLAIIRAREAQATPVSIEQRKKEKEMIITVNQYHISFNPHPKKNVPTLTKQPGEKARTPAFAVKVAST